ncbi:lysyl-tRNA synthetase, partial [Mycoplasmopsis edwardii]
MEKYTEQELVRRNKLNLYKELGIEAFAKADNLKELKYSDEIEKEYGSYSKEELHDKNFEVALTGRIMTMRGPFILIQDYHSKIQLYFNKKEHENLVKLVDSFDLGDIIYAEGYVMKTNTGAVSVKVKNIKLLTKALKPLPDKFHGLVDIEEIYRHRYLDLIMNEESRKVFW